VDFVDNQPELFKQTYKMLLPKDYIIYRLTGEFFTDYFRRFGNQCL
jgi:xylulokinase